MTDKVTVEIPSPLHGRVLELCGDVGDVMKVGTPPGNDRPRRHR
jgi:2-oxoisovalerate dehydrogenase E2 component (dihydrolipoyl transacylase)